MATRSLQDRPPQFRRLRVFAFDPSLDIGLDTIGINQTVVRVPWENVQSGPAGQYVEVIDVDPASHRFYRPVDLNMERLLAEDGLPPSTGDPQFHQQMAYAVTMTTIRNFERALGRVALWAIKWNSEKYGYERYEFVEKLRIYPHALREANAYYDPDKVALLFGYFRAEPNRAAAVLPGGTVFTCLSQDVVAHETTHALLDGLHPRFAEPTNPDVLAFHEAFADIVALFQHFTFPDVLRHQIARTRGDLATENLLAQLAREFSQGSGHYGALRDALGQNVDGKWRSVEPGTVRYTELYEPHERGAVLVGAVFDAFILMYRSRTADLLRIATGGSGVLGSGALHPDLVDRLAVEAARISDHVLQMCIRALDYCPPVDITFGEYLRALVTADYEMSHEDERGYRAAMIEAFRRRGIYPPNVRSLSEGSLRWQAPDPESQQAMSRFLLTKTLPKTLLSVAEWNLRCDREKAFKKARDAAAAIDSHMIEYEASSPNGPLLKAFGLLHPLKSEDKVNDFAVHSVRPARRIDTDGQVEMDLVVEIIQTRTEKTDDGRFLFRGGCTLLIDLLALQQAMQQEDQTSVPALVRYAVYKGMDNERRRTEQRNFVDTHLNAGLNELYFGRNSATYVQAPFAMIHREAARSERES